MLGWGRGRCLVALILTLIHVLYGFCLETQSNAVPHFFLGLRVVTGKFTDFPVCVIRYIFIRKLSHLTISSTFISINQKMHKNHSSF